MYLSNEDKKVHADETFCVYCGACKTVCPVGDALELEENPHQPLTRTFRSLEQSPRKTDLTHRLNQRTQDERLSKSKRSRQKEDDPGGADKLPKKLAKKEPEALQETKAGLRRKATQESLKAQESECSSATAAQT